MSSHYALPVVLPIHEPKGLGTQQMLQVDAPVAQHVTDSLGGGVVESVAADSSPDAVILHLHTPTVHCARLLSSHQSQPCRRQRGL